MGFFKMKMKKGIISTSLALSMIIGMFPISSVHAKSIDYEQKSISSADDLLLYPSPRQMESKDGIYVLHNGKIESDNIDLTAIHKICSDTLDLTDITLSKESGEVVVKLNKDDSLNEQGYSLNINGEGISITYKDQQGAYYAATTLYQILWQSKNELPYLSITNDYPDFQYRAFDMDISRNRLPSVETAKRVIDLMANLKYNQMFFYLEGFSYAYGSYPQVWSSGDPLTPAQAKELSNYAAQRGIDLIPAQNSFGHSYQWIAHNDFQALGDTNGSTTFNVFDEKTQTFLKNIYNDLFDDGFQSDYLQVGGDETSLDLVNGRAVAAWKKLNPGKEPTQSDLYLDSMKIIYNLSEAKNKKMLYWGDMIIHYGLYDQVKKAMPNAIAMDWGYLHDYDFNTSTAQLKAAQIPYYVCPGDSSWSTIVGNTYVMNKNAETAAIAGKKNGALGYAMTNWGDAGHYQNIITTYPAIAYAGGLSWCVETNMKDKSSYDSFLNMFLYQDSTNTLSQAFSKLADFSNEYLPYGWNGNWIANCMIESWSDNTHNLWDFMDFQENGKDNVIDEKVRNQALEQCQQVSQAALTFLEKLKATNIQADDAKLLYKEFKNTAEMTKIAADYAAMRLRLFTGGNITKALSTKEAEKAKAIESAKEFQVMIEDFKTIWKARDVYGELPSTLGWISKPAMMYRDIAGVENIYGPQEDGNLFLKTPETIGTGLSVDDFVVDGWTWTNYGTGMPAISNTYMGGQRVGQLKDALKQKVFSISDGMAGASGMVFAYNSKAAIDGGFYENNPTWGPLLPRCGWPAIIPGDGEYIMSAQVKFKSGRAIHGGTVALSGGANRISNGQLVDVPQNPAWSVSQPDNDGWCQVSVKFKLEDVAGISFGILPQNDIKDDILYITNLVLKQDVPEIVITTQHSDYTVINLDDEFIVPEASSNGKEPITVTLKRPDGKESTVKIGDSIKADATGVYRLSYDAADAAKTLQIVFEVKTQSNNLFIINDENATGFIPSNQFFALVNPYYSGNFGFNTESKLVSYGNDTQDPTQYASLLNNVDGGNGQVILLDTEKLSGNNKVPVVNFCAEIQPGKTYHLSVRMKYWREEMTGGMDLGPFQTAINFFNNEITDQANDQWGGYKYISDYLDDTQKELARNGQWFTYEYEFTVPETVLINGQHRVPTAMNVFFMTSSNDTNADHHKMWLDDASLREAKEDITISEVTKLDDLHVNYGTHKADLQLPKEVAVTLSDGTIRNIAVNWNCDQYDEYTSNTYDFIGTFILPEDILNSANLYAKIKIIVDKEVHNAVKVEAKAATCMEEGNIAYWHCKDCDRYFSDEACTKEITKQDTIIKATGHQHVEAVKAKAATCVEEGNIAYWHCKDCDRYFSDEACTKEITKQDTIIKATGHQHVEAVKAKAATCVEEGNIAYWHCKDCDRYFSDEACTKEITKQDTIIKATGHGTIKVVNKKEATCTSNGYTGDKVCIECGTIIETGSVINKLAHQYKDGKCIECGAVDENYKPENINNNSSVTTEDNSQFVSFTLLAFCSLSIFIFLKKKKRIMK